jgi:hypothetical protein
MKQLLIVKSGTKLNKKADGSTNISTPADLPVGGIAINKLYGDGALLTSAAAGNFTIALGRPNGQKAFVIPEVDFNSLTVTKASFSAGVAMVAQVTVNQSTKDVGFAIVKKDVVPHQRNMLSFSVPGTNVAATDATTLKDQAENRINVMGLPFTISRSSATLTITCTEVGAMYTIVGIGDVTVNTSTGSAHPAEPAIGDKKYIQNLASQCAAGKGFEHTAPEGHEFIPGYPEEVEDKDYWVYTLRFAVHRDSAKTRDEVVSQLVHIAIPNKHTAGTGGAADTDEPEISLDTIFGSKLVRS